MKVCFFIPGFSGGGAEKQCLKIAAALKTYAKAEVTLIYFFEGEYKDLLAASEVRKVHIQISFKSVKALWMLNRELKAARFDVLMSWLPLCDIYAFILKYIFRNPFCWIVAERDSSYKNTPRDRWRMRLSAYANGIIANSARGVELWRNRGIDPATLFFVPNIIDIPFVPHKENAPGVRLLYIGRFEEKKNIPVLLEGMFRLIEANPEGLKIRMVGKGSYRDHAEREILARGLGHYFEILDFDPVPEKHYQWATVFVNASFYEGMANTLAESIMQGVAAVASDLPENRFLLGEDYPFYIPDPRDAAGITRALQEAIAHFTPELYRHAHGVLRNYSSEHVGIQYKNVFNQLLQR